MQSCTRAAMHSVCPSLSVCPGGRTLSAKQVSFSSLFSRFSGGPLRACSSFFGMICEWWLTPWLERHVPLIWVYIFCLDEIKLWQETGAGWWAPGLTFDVGAGRGNIRHSNVHTDTHLFVQDVIALQMQQFRSRSLTFQLLRIPEQVSLR